MTEKQTACPNCGCAIYRYLDTTVHNKTTCSECIWGITIGVPQAKEDYSADVRVSRTEAAAQRHLSDAWNLIAEVIDLATIMDTSERKPIFGEARTHIMALQLIVEQMSAKRHAWVSERLDKYYANA
jgi:hypothetical protein